MWGEAKVSSLWLAVVTNRKELGYIWEAQILITCAMQTPLVVPQQAEVICNMY